MRLLLIPAFRISDLLGELAIQILALVEVGTPERFVLSEREVCSGDNTSRATLRNALAAGESRRFQCLGQLMTLQVPDPLTAARCSQPLGYNRRLISQVCTIVDHKLSMSPQLLPTTGTATAGTTGATTTGTTVRNRSA